MSRPQEEQIWMPDLLARLAMVSGIGYLAAAYTVSRWLTRPTPGKPSRTPADLGLIHEDLECRTSDAFRLVGWAVTPPQPRATICLFHGIRNNRQQTLNRTAFLAAAGYRCVAFDHRAHGQSAGKRSSFGFHETRDVAAVFDLVRRRWPDQPRAAIGISMGGAALCYASHLARDLDAVILESVYVDIASAFINRIGASYPSWFKRLSHGVIGVTQRRLGVRIEQLAPIDHVANLAPAPVLLLTGIEDCHAPPEDAQRLYDRCQGPRELWIVPHAGHKDLFEAGGLDYRDKVLAFLDRWVGNVGLRQAA